MSNPKIENFLGGELVDRKQLKLSAGLEALPAEIFELADTIEILDLSNNKLRTLPAEFSRFKKLKILFLSNNCFEEFPGVLSTCETLSMIGFKANKISHIAEGSFPDALRWLILTDNNISQLPKQMERLTCLQKLMLAGNKLSTLPDLSRCHNLELIRIAANSFLDLPSWIFSLPKLSWLAFAGNPCCPKTGSAMCALPSITWAEFELLEQIGSGASGLIYRVVWNAPNASKQEAALKVFKGEVTSDGYPREEIAAWNAVEKHSNLVKVIGKVIDHPQGSDALLFSLLSRDFKTLAGPPNFDTCTRDVYDKNCSLSFQRIIEISKQAASVSLHLHEHSILHGDLYAHNILANSSGDILLSDFGAAALYSNFENSRKKALQQLEVRAFGCLLDELLKRCSDKTSTTPHYNDLIELSERCLQPQVHERPLFAEIYAALSAHVF